MYPGGRSGERAERVTVDAVGAVVRDALDRLLLVERAHPPGQGLWSLPGGRVEPGESDEAALRREVLEETGLEVEVGRLLGAVERAGPPGVVYRIRDHECRVTGGELHAGDDASAVRWVAVDELESVPLVERLVEALTEFGAL